MKNTKSVLAVTGMVLATLSLTGCDKFNEQFKDSPIEKSRNSSPAQIIEMPDGFSNMASKCDGPNRVYVAYHGDKPFGSVSVVPNDPRCTK